MNAKALRRVAMRFGRAALWLTSLSCLCAQAAGPAAVYRCGSSYQQAPCAPGDKPLAVEDPRSPAQRREAQVTTRDEARLGASMERERREREKALRPAAAVGIGATATPSTPASAPKKDTKKKRKGAKPSGDFVAVAPKPVKPTGAGSR